MSRLGAKSSAWRGLRDGPGAAFRVVVEKHRAAREVRAKGLKTLSIVIDDYDRVQSLATMVGGGQ